MIFIVFLDASQKITEEDRQILADTKDLNRIIITNKIDLPHSESALQKENIVSISAKTGEGLEDLENAIVAPFSPQEVESKGFLVSDARHFDLLQRAKIDVENSISLLTQRMSEEIILIGLHNAIRYLGEITGETTTEDMLTRIFSTFCIGK